MDELGPDDGAELVFDVSPSDRDVLVRMRGDLDMSTVRGLEAAVEPLLRQRPERVIVEAAGLRFADSSALALWVRWANLVDHVEIRQPSEMLRRVIERMGLAERLRMVP